MLEATIDVSYFLKTVDALKEIVREVYLKFSKKGLTVQSMDPAHVAFVTLFFEKDGFDVYKCPKATKCGVDLEFFGSILRLSKSPFDKLTIVVDDVSNKGSSALSQQTQSGPTSMNIILEDEKSKRHAEFTMKLVNFEELEFSVPKLKSDSLLCMRSADFTHICRDLAHISDTVHLRYIEKGINLSVTSDIADGNISIKDNDTMGTEESKEADDKQLLTDVEVGAKNVVQILSQLSLDSGSQEFSLKYVNIFSKGATFSPIIKIHMSNNKAEREPMIMEFKVGDFGVIKYYLAPKISK